MDLVLINLILNKMKNKMISKFKLMPMIVLTVVLIFSACKEESLGDPDRLFRPIISGNVGGTWVTANWDRFDGSERYHIEFSEYEDFSIILKDTIIDGTSITFDGLDYNTDYFFRVKALGKNIESRPMEYKTRTSKLPTKLKVPASNDMIDTQARIIWTEVTYDSLRVFNGKEYIKTIFVSDEDNLDKVLIVTGLDPSTTYTIKAYTAGEYQGEQDYAMADPQVFEGDYVDLRGIDPAEAYSVLDQVFFDSIANLYPGGYTVVLEGGTHYQIPTIKLSANTKIVSGLSFLGRAVWEFYGEVGVNPGVNLQNITLEGLIVTDHPSALRSASNYGGKYLLGIRGTTADTKIGEIKVVNCDVRYKRGFFRAQAPVEVEQVTIDNCVIDSMGGYGVVNADNAGSYLKNIKITNTTISNCDKILVDTKSNPLEMLNSVYLENITILTKGGNYVLDYPDKPIPGGVTMKKVIIGNGDGGTPKGMRNAAMLFTLEDNYRASDVNWTNPIEFDVLSQTTPEIFENPAELNFRFNPSFTNDKVVGKVGDPRWW